MVEKRKFFKKPFEGCIEVKGKGYTDVGFHDISKKDDEKFIRNVQKIKKEI